MEVAKYKTIYLYDNSLPSHKYQGKLEVKDDRQLLPGETLVAPKEGQDNYWNTETGDWVASIVTIFCYDVNNDNRLTDFYEVPAGVTIKTGQTTVRPKEGLYDPRFNGTDWESSISEEEWLAKQPKQPDPKPTTTQQLVMNQQASITQLEQTVMKQQSSMTQLQQLAMSQQAEIAQLKKGSN